MSKKRVKITILIIFVLAFLAGSLVFPGYLNQGIDSLNNFSSFNLPHFLELPFKLGLDLQGGSHLIYEADLSEPEETEWSAAMEGLRDIIERRVNFFGVQEPVVQTQEGANYHRLVVELAGIKDPAEAIREIGKTPFLEFRKQRANYQQILDSNLSVIEAGEGELQDPFQSTLLTGRYLEKAEMSLDQTSYKSLVLIQFNEEGSKIFEDLTAENVGKALAISIDGVIISAPTVQEKILGGKAQISGDFTVDEAKELVSNLNAGALPVPISLISQQSVGPTLGTISLEKSLKAGILGFLLIILFLILYYRLPGFLASLALLVYGVVILSLFKLIPVTLTLAGIGGVILSIGMAVDANVLIFERMKEELKRENSFGRSIEEGFDRAWSSIRDGNITTLIVAMILFSFGTSFIKGFAFTLSIGILVSMFSAIVITRTFLRYFIGTRLERIKWLWE